MVASVQRWHGLAEDTELIATFTVLGLLLFSGGAYAIYDGWPYLVLERGFTQVIIGSIASGAGLIMLSLAWVLKEIRATRRALAEAIGLRVQGPPPAVALADPPLFAPPARSEEPAVSPSVAPAAIGAVAGAGATEAVAQALSVSEGMTPSPAEAPAPSAERDLFGTLVTRALQEPEPEPVAHDEIEAAGEPGTDSAEPLPDMFEEAMSAAPPPAPVAPSAPFGAEEHEQAEPGFAAVQPVAEEQAFVGFGEPEPFRGEPAEEPPMVEGWPAADAEAAKAPAAAEGDHDEFSALRASLAGHLNEPEHAAGRIEPSVSTEPDPFAAAESWMDRALPAEPWLDKPADEPAPLAEEAPLWPRTEAPVQDEPGEPATAGLEVQEHSAVDAPAHGEAAEARTEQLSEPAAADAPQEGEAPAAPDGRPASDEGIVGAYQVGDAHFTIYADGSIRARTPDGEYSFASMNELKVYLASEKSRLGF